MNEIANDAVETTKSAPAPQLTPEGTALVSVFRPPEPRGHPAMAAIVLPRTSTSVLVVLDANGDFTQLCTAGDLLRWCKAVWWAEQEWSE